MKILTDGSLDKIFNEEYDKFKMKKNRGQSIFTLAEDNIAEMFRCRANADKNKSLPVRSGWFLRKHWLCPSCGRELVLEEVNFCTSNLTTEYVSCWSCGNCDYTRLELQSVFY